MCCGRRRCGIRSFAAQHHGLVFEDKGASVALHYRLAPQLARAAQSVVREAAVPLGEAVEVQEGKMVVELKPAGCDKGKAIAQFMREAPFEGRVPVFLGDDVTDEYGFRVVNATGRPHGEGRRGPERGALAHRESGGGARLATGLAGVLSEKGSGPFIAKRVLTPL